LDISLWRQLKVKRLLEMLRRDHCDDSVICDCSLTVGNHLNADDNAADLSAVCGADKLQPSPLRPRRQAPFNDVNSDQQVSSSVSVATPPELSTPKSSLSSAVYTEHNAASGQCRTFKLPDVHVRLTSPQQQSRSIYSDHVSRPSITPVAVVIASDVINDPHYTVV